MDDLLQNPPNILTSVPYQSYGVIHIDYTLAYLSRNNIK